MVEKQNKNNQWKEKARPTGRPITIGRPTTPPRPTARRQATTNLPSLNSPRIKPERRQPIAKELIDMYKDESITGNDYDFDYDSVQDVQFKPSSKIQTTHEGNTNQSLAQDHLLVE